MGSRRYAGLGAVVLSGMLGAGLLGACGGSTNDPVAREALIRASLRSAAAKSYVAVVDAGKPSAVTFTYVAPDRLRVEQGHGKDAVVMVQVALNGYHSRPGDPGRFTKRLENVSPANTAPLGTVGTLIVGSTHVRRHGNTIRFDVAYGNVTAHLLVDLDSAGRIADAELPVFDNQRKVVAYRLVTFGDYDHASAVVAPAARSVTGG